MEIYAKHRWVMLVGSIVVLSLLMWSIPSYAQAKRSYFDASTTRSSDLKPFPKWTGVLSRYFKESRLKEGKCSDTGKFNLCHLRQWQSFIDSMRGKSLREQINAVNRFHNKTKYIVDPINWGMKDYWATPKEFHRKNGDCEDYAIAKFISLRALGVSNSDMRIVILQDFNLGGIIHAVLAVDGPDGEVLLDNQIKQVIKSSKVYHYKPVYSINETAWWRYKH